MALNRPRASVLACWAARRARYLRTPAGVGPPGRRPCGRGPGRARARARGSNPRPVTESSPQALFLAAAYLEAIAAAETCTGRKNSL